MGTGKPVFTAYNNHSADSKNPPFFTNRDHPKHYCGYFENVHGEQFVFVFDREKRQGTVWGGDCGWKSEMAVREIARSELPPEVEKGLAALQHQGVVDLDAKLTAMGLLPLGKDRFLHVPGVNMTPDELKWLGACWIAAKGLV